MDHVIRQYRLEPGAWEIQYIEEMFREFTEKKKTAAEIIKRLEDREHLILLSMARSPEDPDLEIPVAFKVGHELRGHESDLKLTDLTFHLRDVVRFDGRK